MANHFYTGIEGDFIVLQCDPAKLAAEVNTRVPKINIYFELLDGRGPAVYPGVRSIRAGV